MTESLSFKLKDLVILLKSRYSKDDITEALFSFNFLTISDDFEHVTYTLGDHFKTISLLNVPQGMTKDDLEKELGTNDKDYVRFYKKSMCWVLVHEGNIDGLIGRLNSDIIV
jgi:hypothetical protein